MHKHMYRWRQIYYCAIGHTVHFLYRIRSLTAVSSVCICQNTWAVVFPRISIKTSPIGIALSTPPLGLMLIGFFMTPRTILRFALIA